jgi:hypothetical protein
MDWGTVFLYLHIGGVIVAFGSSIAFPFIAAKAQKEPMHGNFALRVTEFITERVVEPGAVFVFLTGAAMLYFRGLNPLTTFWVGAAVVLFLIAFAYANLVQLPTLRRMVALTARPPIVAGGGAGVAEVPALAGPGTPAAEGAGPAGPPPEFLALAGKAARGGQFLTLMIFVILSLMVFKPTF